MSAPVLTIDGDVSIEGCSARMSAESVRRFPVIIEGEIAGVISDRHPGRSRRASLVGTP